MSRKPKRPHDPRFAKPGTPPPSPAEVDRMVAEFKLNLLEYDLKELLSRIEKAKRAIGGKP